MSYRAPIKDITFTLETVAGINNHIEADLLAPILEEAASLAEDVWVETNSVGDSEGVKLEKGKVKTPDCFVNAYSRFVKGGWQSIILKEEFGGQELPRALGLAIDEIFQSSNLALSICPLLNQAVIEVLEDYCSKEQQAEYMPNLIEGKWSGTMQLTEAQAGSDLFSVRLAANKDGDKYFINGQKIFISWGDNDFVENIVHIVLANLERNEDNRGGLRLFIVPKFIEGKFNNIITTALEHKVGLHGSPTCVMSFNNAEGFLIENNEGKVLQSLFAMMNKARIGVGLQGVALSESSYQEALAYARERVQGQKLGGESGKRVTIIEHQDVRRMLLRMKSTTEAMRALVYYSGRMMDLGEESSVAFITPLIKSWCSDVGFENTSLGLQIHGGIGYMQESPASQYFRDSRVLSIYEGTNGIQAIDFVFRKVIKDDALEAKRFINEIREFVSSIPQTDIDLNVIRMSNLAALEELEKTTDWIIANAKDKIFEVSASALPYLEEFAYVLGGYMHAKMALVASNRMGEDKDFFEAKIISARFYSEIVLPKVYALSKAVCGGYSTVERIGNDQF